MVLNAMRGKKFSKRVLGGLLIIIVPAFVLWGVGSISDRPKPAGRIFGRTISAEDFHKSRQGIKVHLILNYFTDYDTINSVIRDRSLVNAMTWERLLLLMGARDKRIEVPDREVLSFISSHPLFQRAGVFDREVYESVLRNPFLSMSPRQFEELTRENLMIRKFSEALAQDIKISEGDILKKYSENNDKVVFSWMLVDKDAYMDEVAVTEEEVRASYERNKDRLYSPERAEVEYVEASYSSAEERQNIEREMERSWPELFRENVSLEQFAADMGFRFASTVPFAEADTLAAIEWSEGFNETAFALEKGEISYPVFSHPEEGSAFIIKRTEVEMPRPVPFGEIKEHLEQAIRNVKSIELAGEKAEQLHQELSSGAITFEDAAALIDAEIKTTEALNKNGWIAEKAPAEDAVLFAIENGSGSFPSPALAYEGLLLLRTEQIVKAPATELTSEMRSELEEVIFSEKQDSVINDWLREHSPSVEAFRPLEEM